MEWDYEPLVLRLPSGQAFLPDFRLSGGRFIEVKGYVTEADRVKIAQARAVGHRVLFWTGKKLLRLGILSASFR
jgi:hypothetical protein